MKQQRDATSRAELWQRFFAARALGMILFAGATLPPLSVTDPKTGVMLLMFAVPLNIASGRLAIPRSYLPWLMVFGDAIFLSVALAFDPAIAPAVGIVLMGSTSMAATAGWKPTLMANAAALPLIGFSLSRQAPDTLWVTLTASVGVGLGVAVFVAAIAQSERRSRINREALLDGLDAVVWEAFPYPFVKAEMSGRTEDLLGIPPEQLAGDGAWLARLPAFDRAQVVALSQAQIEQGNDHELAYRIVNAAGDVRHVRDRVRVEVDEHGTPITSRGILVDITDEVRVRETNRNLAELVERVPVGLVVAQAHTVKSDPEFITITVNPAYESITGLSATGLVNTSLSGAILGPGRAEVEQILRNTLATGQTQRVEEAPDLRANGNRVMSLEAFMISNDLIGLNVVDVTERVTTAETLRRQALHDTLTGLPNRTLLEDRLRHAVTAADRDGRSVGLLLLDLDQFKEINDTLGHDEGDSVLRVVADRIRDSLRSVDTVARLGGDEFAVLLVDDVTPRRILRTAERVLTCFDEPMEIEGITLKCGASVGVAMYPEHGDSADVLRKHADIAMYVAKRRGGGVAVYDTERDHTSIDRLNLMNELREAIENDDLVLHYQPAVDIATGNIDRAEALVRWEHPERGIISPAEFIDLAEVSGLIRPLTQWILHQTVSDLRELENRGHTIGASVNISVRNLYEPSFVDSIRSLLELSGVRGNQLTLELTETQVMDDPHLAHSVLGRLRDFGVMSSIDDFGTGHSSLTNLQSLPVSEVKIDRSFVSGLDTGEDASGVIVRSIIALGHNLGLEVVAEGVETNEALTQLSLLGCDRVQGYLLAKPVPIDELEQVLTRARQEAII